MKYAFYGDGVTSINDKNHLIRAIALYNNYFESKAVKAYIPSYEYDLLDLDGLNKGVGGIEWARVENTVVHSRPNSLLVTEELVISEIQVEKDRLVSIRVDNSNGLYLGDRFQIIDNVSGHNNVRLKRHDLICMMPYQFYCNDYLEHEGGAIDIHPYPDRLISDSNFPIEPGMKLGVLPSHKLGLIIGENQSDKMDLIFPATIEDGLYVAF